MAVATQRRRGQAIGAGSPGPAGPLGPHGMRGLLSLALLAAACAAALLLPGYYAFLIGLVAVSALACTGLNVLLGLAGEVSLGQGGFLALGAYGVAVLTTRAGLPFLLAWPLAAALTAGAALLLAVPALRVSGPYLAMVTIAFGFIVDGAATEWRGLTGGATGIAGIPGPFDGIAGALPETLAGLHGTAALACLCCAAGLAGFGWLRRSPLGLAMAALAAAPAAARSVGVQAVRVRTAAFVIAAGAAGVAGGLQAGLTGFIAPSSFPFSQSILFLLVVMVGGAGSTAGPLAGAVLVGLLPELLSGLAEYRQLVFGAGLLGVLWLAPSGLAALWPRRRAAAVAASGDVTAFLRRGGSPGLQVEGLGVAFGGVRALDGVGLHAPPGAITGIIGPNGAGKTTLLNALTGFVRPAGGTVRCAGRMARTFQTAQMPGGQTVLDCVRTGLLRGRWRGRGDPALAAALLRFAGFTGDTAAPSGSLPHPDRRLVEVARALATRPSVLLLDEPAAGLDAADTARLGPVLRRVAECGIAVVLVEHDMDLVMSACSRLFVLDAGRLIAQGTPAEVRADPAVRAAYLGSGAARPARPAAPAGAPLLAVQGLQAGYGGVPVLRGLDLVVGRGEMVALLGPNGAGKSTLMRALSGLLRPVRGGVAFAGQDVAGLPAHAVARRGLVLVPEGRQVFPGLSVADNMRLGATARRDFDPVEIEAMLERFPRLRPLLGRAAGVLSGGEQQMLALARGLLARPALLLLDEPSLGLAPAVTAELFDALSRLRDEGLTLLLVDQRADLALPLADRVAVLSGGVIGRSGPAAEMAGGLDYLGTAA